MQPKEKAVIITLGLVILGTATLLGLLGASGIVDFANSLGYIANQAALIGLILLCLVCGYVLVRSQHQEPPAASVQKAQQDETVWPPAPKREEPGTGSARLIGETVSDTIN